MIMRRCAWLSGFLRTGPRDYQGGDRLGGNQHAPRPTAACVAPAVVNIAEAC